MDQNTKKIGDGEEGFLHHHALEEEDLTQQQREWMARHWSDPRMSCQLNRAVAAFLVTMAKRAPNRLNILFEDASAGRLVGRGVHIEWCASRRPCKRGDCNGPYEVVNNELDDWWRTGSIRWWRRCGICCSAFMSTAKQTDPGVEWIDAMRGALNGLDEVRLCAILEGRYVVA